MDFQKYLQTAHQTSKKNGFWDDSKTKKSRLALAVCEIAEAIEADRNGLDCLSPRKILENYTNEKYKGHVKDTRGDELAGCVLRLLDYAAGYQLNIDLSNVKSHLTHVDISFVDNCSFIMGEILAIDDKPELIKTSLGLILGCAIRFGIDLDTHIQLAIKYNANRPPKHGKKY